MTAKAKVLALEWASIGKERNQWVVRASDFSILGFGDHPQAAWRLALATLVRKRNEVAEKKARVARKAEAERSVQGQLALDE